MASKTLPVRCPVSQCLRRKSRQQTQLPSIHYLRSFTTSTSLHADVAASAAAAEPMSRSRALALSLDAESVSHPKLERLIAKHQHVQPVGSRRRRVLRHLYQEHLPFEQLPYQCFQEARKVLAADREEKLAQIAEMRVRIGKVMERSAESMGGDYVKKGRLVRMQKWLEELKILADINDPLIKKRFEDGMGDMNRPIYRHLAQRKWAEYNQKIQIQRISQFHLVPDILTHLSPTADISLAFGRRKIPPGSVVDSLMSEKAARLRVQVFDKGQRLVSVAVVDPDVPDEANDSFKTRCHYLAVNIPLAPDAPRIPLRNLKASKHVAFDWQAPYSQKGSPYHRLAIFVLQQPEGQVLDIEKMKQGKLGKRDGWQLQGFITRSRASPIAATLFRTVWDEKADEVARRAGYEEVGRELIRTKSEKNVYKKKDGARYR